MRFEILAVLAPRRCPHLAGARCPHFLGRWGPRCGACERSNSPVTPAARIERGVSWSYCAYVRDSGGTRPCRGLTASLRAVPQFTLNVREAPAQRDLARLERYTRELADRIRRADRHLAGADE